MPGEFRAFYTGDKFLKPLEPFRRKGVMIAHDRSLHQTVIPT
ncbi:hypothetical protein HMPREF9336_04292 [Segniliparus rugosus ATCC BAA-974]|uniref:Uncharacterized protein n=1 Tax=Segniliparus rugosus (strain ATCC BAA-974 / DSM 45345 / CCUG 50838 / CIP 108380 / JCM 13579 / CDC 945) TaxID=679197 RepID=U1N8H9_SEGRC|nr:hypothetical protein HMPREF9336_04292 [Segniliparus rugosus ATCC BAA-974]